MPDLACFSYRKFKLDIEAQVLVSTDEGRSKSWSSVVTGACN